MLLPIRVVIPLDGFLVGEKNIGFAVTVHVRNGQALADLDLIINRDRAELGQRRFRSHSGKDAANEQKREMDFHGLMARR